MKTLEKLGFIPPVLLATFFCLLLYADNKVLIPTGQVAIPTLISASIAGIIYALFWLKEHNTTRASLLTCVFVGAWMVYGYSHIASYILGVGTVVLLLVRIKLPRLIPIFLVFTGAMLLVPVISVATTPSSYVTRANDIEDNSLQANLPSIYHIILDSYAGKPTLDKLSIDNSQFYQFLEDKGFTINHDSFCNYPRTYLSLASELSMEYLEPSITYREAVNTIRNSLAGQRLKQLGYHYTHIGTAMWWPTAENGIANTSLSYTKNSFIQNEFSITLIATTPLGNFNDYRQRRFAREAVLFQFNTLEKIARKDTGGNYIFSHILLPHHNFYLFDKNGNLPTIKTHPDSYANHITYSNQRIMGLMKLIPDTAIIILQSDEGYFSHKTYQWIEEENGKLPGNSIIEERAYILNAIRIPNYSGSIPDSPVNIYRLILGKELLPDMFYFPLKYWGEGAGDPSSKFVDMTEEVKL